MIVKVSGGIREDGIIIGNTYDKYGSRNLIVRRLMQKFESSLTDLIAKAAPQTIHEIGCGEGYWVLRWQELGFKARGCDFSSKVIEIARKNAENQKLPVSLFNARSIYDLTWDADAADLIVCCEVLEHLERPEEGLRALQRVVGRHLIVSVPREPIWRVLNLARGKYIADFGNTPGHIQHWSKRDFAVLVSKYFEIVEVKNPLPWTMLLCRPRA